MRIKANDPGFHDVLLTLDGDLIGCIVEADTDEGWVDQLNINPLDPPDKPSEVVRKYGKVEIAEPVTKPVYKAVWKEFDLNKSFWEEVFIGRKIVSLIWKNEGSEPGGGVGGVVLDSGERVYFHNNTCCIRS